MAALGQIDLKGNDITTDSFDSCDPNYNDGSGGYPVGNLSKTKANGDICTDGVITDTLHVGNANIKGVVKTGPGQNTIGVGPNGSVGDRAWVEGGSSGIQTGHSATDFNVLFPSVTLPPTTWNLKVANNVTTNGTTYKYYFATGGDYWINNLGNNDNVYIATGANVRLKITGNVNPSGQFVIRIAPDNATLQIFEAGSQFNLGGQAMVDNMSGHADRFILYGLPNCTSISLAGNANFYGCIYAPQAAFTLGGGGSTTYDFVGSSVTGSVTMNGHFNFHYDECLRQKTPARGYIPTRWEETSNN